MITIDFRNYFHDRIWFGYVWNRQENQGRGRFIWLGWYAIFPPIRRREYRPPEWYLKLFNIDYH